METTPIGRVKTSWQYMYDDVNGQIQQAQDNLRTLQSNADNFPDPGWQPLINEYQNLLWQLEQAKGIIAGHFCC